jgi:hypothetical protein
MAFGRTPARESRVEMAIAHWVLRDFKGRRVICWLFIANSGFKGLFDILL